MKKDVRKFLFEDSQDSNLIDDVVENLLAETEEPMKITKKDLKGLLKELGFGDAEIHDGVGVKYATFPDSHSYKEARELCMRADNLEKMVGGGWVAAPGMDEDGYRLTFVELDEPDHAKDGLGSGAEMNTTRSIIKKARKFGDSPGGDKPKADKKKNEESVDELADQHVAYLLFEDTDKIKDLSERARALRAEGKVEEAGAVEDQLDALMRKAVLISSKAVDSEL